MKSIFEAWEENVSENLTLYQGQEELRTRWQKRGVELGAADQKNLAAVTRLHDFIQIMNDPHSRKRVARDDPVFPTRQRFAKRLISLSSHQDNVAQGRSFEELEVLRQMPGDFSPAPITRFKDIAAMAFTPR